eukprot:729686-Rhodomonas_salina.2
MRVTGTETGVSHQRVLRYQRWLPRHYCCQRWLHDARLRLTARDNAQCQCLFAEVPDSFTAPRACGPANLQVELLPSERGAQPSARATRSQSQTRRLTLAEPRSASARSGFKSDASLLRPRSSGLAPQAQGQAFRLGARRASGA